jgi:hypothetical protein
LKRLYEDDDPRGVIGEHVIKLRDILAAARCSHRRCGHGLARAPATSAQGRVKGLLGGYGSRQVAVIFRFAGGEVVDIDYLDYH